MRKFFPILAAAAALLYANTAYGLEKVIVYELHVGSVVQEALACTTLEKLHVLMHISAHNGPEAATSAFLRLNAKRDESGRRECMTVGVRTLRRAEALEAYPLVEFTGSVLRDVLVVKALDHQGHTRYIALEREAGRGNAI